MADHIAYYTVCISHTICIVSMTYILTCVCVYMYVLYRLSPLLIPFFESCVREPTSTIQQPSYRRSREGSAADLSLTYNPCHAADDEDVNDEEEKGEVGCGNHTSNHIHKRHMNGATTNNHDSIEYSRL